MLIAKISKDIPEVISYVTNLSKCDFLSSRNIVIVVAVSGIESYSVGLDRSGNGGMHARRHASHRRTCGGSLVNNSSEGGGGRRFLEVDATRGLSIPGSNLRELSNLRGLLGGNLNESHANVSGFLTKADNNISSNFDTSEVGS